MSFFCRPSLLTIEPPLKLASQSDKEDYTFKQITQKQAEEQGPYFEMVDGIEVPVPGKPLSSLLTPEYQLPPKELPKRKAGAQPEGQPSPKIAATAKEDQAVPEMARHSASMLASVEALEDGSATPPETGSNAATPPPEVVDAPSPAGAEQAGPPQASGTVTPRDPLDLAIPRGASQPDECGVRIISRRPTRLDIPNNRIMVPNLFEWDDLDIGFRDSTNSIYKGATKAKRGKYLNGPGSNYMFVDRRVGTWDSTQISDELDDDLIKKHKLHPTLGIVLPTSVNEQEPPKPQPSGWKPVVFVAPNGERFHASRTIQRAKIDRTAEEIEHKLAIQDALRAICAHEGIAEEEIAPGNDVREQHRREKLIAQGLDPDRTVPAKLSPTTEAEPTRPDTSVFDAFVAIVLQQELGIEAEEDSCREAASQPAHQSRPYDAIRDSYTASSSTPTDQPDVPSVQEQPRHEPPDTAGLLLLATAAEMHGSARQPPVKPDLVIPLGQETTQDMIDPTLSSHPHPNGTGMEDGNVPRPDQLCETAQHGLQSDHDFLKTALNPTPAVHPPPLAASVSEYHGVPIAPAPPRSPGSATGRTPFSNPAAAKALPALRPVRSLLNDCPPPELLDSPSLQQPQNMISSGNPPFFSPVSNRSYLNGYPAPEQQILGQPLQQPILMQPPAPGPQNTPQPAQMNPYNTVTPPPYHNGPPPLAPAPGAISQTIISAPIGSGPGGPPLVFVAQGPPPLQVVNSAMLPASQSPGSRPGSSSAAAGPASLASAVAASNKYRKLEPAPTPPHRLGYAGNGQELKTVQFDTGSIKDYDANNSQLPQTGPLTVRGWSQLTQNTISKKTQPTRPASSSRDVAISVTAQAGIADEPS